MKLLIFDVDGTLTHLAGATRRAFDAAFLQVFSVSAQIDGVKMHGRTDPLIFRDCFQLTALPGDWQAAYQAFCPVYADILPEKIATASGSKLHPGVMELLLELERRKDRVALALGTGNMESGARTKIGHFGLNHFFPVGGFGDIHQVRKDLIFDAVVQSEKFYRTKFSPQDSWVIGDTEFDIEGGKAVGLMTMGVATGGMYSREQLIASGADVVFEDFSDTQAVLTAFGAN